MPDPNTPLVSRADSQAFVQSYQRYERLILAVIRKYVSDPYVQEDLVQDTLVGLIQAKQRLASLPREVLPAYVAAAARNHAINYLRRQRWVQVHITSLEEHWDLAAACPPPEEALLAWEMRQVLRRIWPSLPRREQQLLGGRYLLGYSDRQLSRLLGCRPSSVRMLLTRARRRARALVQDSG